MAVPTRSSKPQANGRALASAALGLLAAAALPGAIAAAELGGWIALLHAAGAIPVALVGGALALWLARGARRRSERTLGRVGGRRAAAAGRVLGTLGVLLSLAGATSVATYLILARLAE